MRRQRRRIFRELLAALPSRPAALWGKTGLKIQLFFVQNPDMIYSKNQLTESRNRDMIKNNQAMIQDKSHDALRGREPRLVRCGAVRVVGYPLLAGRANSVRWRRAG